VVVGDEPPVIVASNPEPGNPSEWMNSREGALGAAPLSLELPGVIEYQGAVPLQDLGKIPCIPESPDFLRALKKVHRRSFGSVPPDQNQLAIRTDSESNQIAGIREMRRNRN
jgi:hypothetical protein